MRTIASAASTFDNALTARWLDRSLHWTIEERSGHGVIRPVWARGRSPIGYPCHPSCDFDLVRRADGDGDGDRSRRDVALFILRVPAAPVTSVIANARGAERMRHWREQLAVMLHETQGRAAIDASDLYTRRLFDPVIESMHGVDIVRLLCEMSAALDGSWSPEIDAHPAPPLIVTREDLRALDDAMGRAPSGRGRRVVAPAGSQIGFTNAGVVDRVRPAAKRTPYSVRESEATAVADTVTGLWRRNLHFAPDVELEARLRWYYLEGPAGPGRVMLLMAGDTVVGCEGIGVRSFMLAGRSEPMRVALIGDLAVERSHRTLMPALTLIRAGRAAAKELAVHYGFPNAAAAPLYERIGYRKLGMLTRWVRIVRHAHYLTRVVKHPVVARMGGAVLDQAIRVRALSGRVIVEPHLKLELLADADERLDRLWEAAHRQWGMVGWRGAGFVRWRFLRSPGSRSELVALVERRTEIVRAYAVLEPIAGTFHLRDFFGVDLRDIGRMLDLLIPYLARRGAIAISVSFLGAPRVEALLRAHHFHARESTRTVIVDAAPGVAATRAEDWYLTDGDEDT